MKKNKPNIKTIFIIISLITLFSIITIIAIINAQGKKIGSNGELISTSIIRINSQTSDLTAFIDDRKVNITNNRIENINPGEITLRIEKEGFTAWKKNIKLEAGVVKDIYVQLYPAELNFEQITNSNVDKIFFSKNPDFIFYTIIDPEIPTDVGVWKLKLTRNLLDFGNRTPEKIITFDNDFLLKIQQNEYFINISNDNNKLVLSVPNTNDYLIFNADNSNNPINLLEELGYTPDEFFWFRNSDSLIIREKNVLFEFELNSKQKYLINYFNSENIVYSVGLNVVFFFREDNQKLYRYLNKNSVSINELTNLKLLENINSVYAIDKENSMFLIKNKDNTLFIDLNKNFVDNIGSIQNVVSISADGEKIIFEKDNKLMTYILEPTPDLKSYNPKINEIYFDITQVQKIFFSPLSSNILAFVRNNETTSLWLMDIDGGNKKQIVNEKTISGTTSQIVPDGSSLYLLLEDSGNEQNISIKKNIYKLNLQLR